MPSNVASKKGPVTLDNFGTYNTVTYAAGDFLLFNSFNGTAPTSTGWTRITPDPGFDASTGANQLYAWKIATSSSETFTGITTGGGIVNSVFVFKNGVSIGGYANSVLPYTGTSSTYYTPQLTLSNTDGSSVVLQNEAPQKPNTTGYTDLPYNNGYYNFQKRNSTNLSVIAAVNLGSAIVGSTSLIEIKNT